LTAIPILDSHTHAWRRWPYAPAVPDPSSHGSVEQLLWEMDVNGVESALVVCASIDGNPNNLRYATEAAAANGRLHVLADVDCPWSATYHTPGAAERLEGFAERYPLVGLTHYVTAQNDGWLLSRDADALVEVAERRRLLLSLALTPHWHADLRSLASRHPGAVFICHHLGGLQASDASGSSALDEVLKSAAVPNIYVKASGFHYCSEKDWNHPWHDALEVLRILTSVYGPERLFWGSDFPASRRYCTYRQSLEAVRTHARFLTPEERAAILGGNLKGLLDRSHKPKEIIDEAK